MIRKKVLILSVSAGAGHVRAAEALRVTAERDFPGADVVHIDLMEIANKLFRKLYADSFTILVEHEPALWAALYRSTDKPGKQSAGSDLRQAIENFNIRKLKKTLKREAPDAVICTHFLPAQFMSLLVRKEKFDRPVWVVVTDFDIHGMWVQSHLSGYFAAAEEVAWRMRDRGIAESSIHVTGIPVMPVFGAEYSRRECAAELGLDPARKTVLLIGGSAGAKRIKQLCERLLALPGDFQIAAIAGKSPKILRQLEDVSKHADGRMAAIGFTKTIERVMAAADLVITKPGGLITSECLAAGLPMLLISAIPGQEERNATYLLECGAALEAYDDAAVEFRVSGLMSDSKRLAAMKRNARKAGRPKAAHDILSIVLKNAE